MSARARKVLIIPHQPQRGVKVRALELARHLAGSDACDVSVLTWDAMPTPQRGLARLIAKAGIFFRTLATKPTANHRENIRWVTLPHLLFPYPACQKFNEAQLAKHVAQEQYDVIISASAYLFPVPEAFDGLSIYDVVDDHVSAESGPFWRRTKAFTLAELRKADRVITVSFALKAVLQELGYPAEVLPNGVDLSAFKTAPPDEAMAVRTRYDCRDRFVVGYIGNHGSWAGMEFLCETFLRFHARFAESRLLIVGPGEDLDFYRKKYADNNAIIFTGPIASEKIAAYFHACDIGVLPFSLSPFTHHALPLKILEYGAAKKRVLASPLQELVTLNFPHVALLPLEPERWTAALETAAAQWKTGDQNDWPSSWDAVIASYDWPLIWRKLEAVMAEADA